MKKEAMRLVDSMSTFTQQMVDQVFSFGEPGLQEEETSKYLTGILEKNGFKVTRGVAGIPTAWTATWGSGKPVISLGSDIDDIPQANQKPGVGYKDPMVTGAPGHGEGHNAGVPMNITAAIAVKKIMEREHIPGTIHLWPGVAEELMAGKAYFVRAGVFKDVDAVLFAHVGNDMGVSYGQSQSGGAHQRAVPLPGLERARRRRAVGRTQRARRGRADGRRRGSSAASICRCTQRSHYVITDGGDQPNVVPPTATVWYYFREQDAPKVQALFALGDTIARAAAMMTSTKLVGVDIVGGGWSGHFNKVIADADEREHQDGRHAEVGREATSSSRAAFSASSARTARTRRRHWSRRRWRGERASRAAAASEISAAAARTTSATCRGTCRR